MDLANSRQVASILLYQIGRVMLLVAQTIAKSMVSIMASNLLWVIVNHKIAILAFKTLGL